MGSAYGLPVCDESVPDIPTRLAILAGLRGPRLREGKPTIVSVISGTQVGCWLD